MTFYFLDLIGVADGQRIELREPRSDENYVQLTRECCDLMIPYRSENAWATIEVVVINLPNGSVRPDLLRILHEQREAIWRRFGHLAYQVDQDGRKVG